MSRDPVVAFTPRVAMDGLYDSDEHRLAEKTRGLADVGREGLSRTKKRGGAQAERALNWDEDPSTMKGEAGRVARQQARDCNTGKFRQ